MAFDFTLTDEQELLLENVREFCARNIDESKIKKWYDAHGIPDELAEAYLDAGFGLMGIPEKYGGIPCDLITLGLLTEEMHHLSGCILPFIQTTLGMFDIVEFGSEEQIKMCMDVYMKTGKPIFALAISEPGAGSDNASMTTTTKEANGKFVLNGSKTWITNGEVYPYTLVLAKDEDSDPRNRNISMWLFPRDTPGVSTSSVPKIGQQIWPFCELYFDNVVLDESCRVGERGQGFMNLMKNFEMERCLMAAQALGLAQAAMDDAAAYVSQRVTFGQTISKHQMIQEKLADMEIKLQNIRNTLYKTLWKLDNGQPVQIDSALLKRYASRAATEICSDAIQIFGGLGYTNELRVGRLWIDCRGNEIAGGTNEIMVHIAGRQLVKKYAK